MDRRHFVFQLSDHTAEGAGATLSVLRKCEDFALESCAHSHNLVVHVGALLIHKHVDSLGLDIPVKVTDLEVLLVEARQDFPARGTEHQFLKRTLLIVVDSASNVGDRNTRI